MIKMPAKMLKHPELDDKITLMPCGICLDKNDPHYGWIYLPHANGKWVSSATLSSYIIKMVEEWNSTQNQ